MSSAKPAFDNEYSRGTSTQSHSAVAGDVEGDEEYLKRATTESHPTRAEDVESAKEKKEETVGKIELHRYGTGKPKRIKIRARITQ